jgi:predicted AAA+ superfamily ATPase
VDFVLKKGLTIEALIQACYQIDDEKVKSREVSSIVEASEELSVNHLIVITFDYEGKEVHKNKEIKFIPLWKFLTNSKF